jgi:hypothetical protein
MVKKLNLKNPIICGASMAGQISLACAIRADEVGCIGTIPLQGSDFLDMKRQWFDQSPHTNQALFNPEWIYGVSLSFFVSFLGVGGVVEEVVVVDLREVTDRLID